MEKEMTGADRRKKLILLMRESEQPLSGTQLGKVTGVTFAALHCSSVLSVLSCT